MKLTNLWYFFFNSKTANAGAAEFEFDADGIGQAAQAELDSRGWFQRRFHVQIPIRLRPVRVPIPSRPVVGAEAAVRLSSVSLSAPEIGDVSVYTDASISVRIPIRGMVLRILLGQTRVATDVHAVLPTFGTVSSMSNVQMAASARPAIRGIGNRSALGRVAVLIGPDMVQQDDEDVLMLLEVA